MKAVCWHGRNDIRVDQVPDPIIEDDRDAVIQVTASGICGSDLHLMAGSAPSMQSGDVIGHEPMGVVVDVGRSVRNLKVGDKVVVPFTIACGSCFFCDETLFSLCDNSNRNAEQAQIVMGHSPSGMFGYTHLQRYMEPLLRKVLDGTIDPSFVITHREPLEHASEAYAKFRDKTDGCIKVVLMPGMRSAA